MTRKLAPMPSSNWPINSRAAGITGAIALLTAAAVTYLVRTDRPRFLAAGSRLAQLYAHPVTVSQPTGDIAASELAQ